MNKIVISNEQVTNSNENKTSIKLHFVTKKLCQTP